MRLSHPTSRVNHPLGWGPSRPKFLSGDRGPHPLSRTESPDDRARETKRDWGERGQGQRQWEGSQGWRD